MRMTLFRLCLVRLLCNLARRNPLAVAQFCDTKKEKLPIAPSGAFLFRPLVDWRHERFFSFRQVCMKIFLKKVEKRG